jgi:phosphatidate cytidylyltransferase
VEELKILQSTPERSVNLVLTSGHGFLSGPPSSVPQAQIKPSKSAQKKAAQATRTEKKAKATKSQDIESSHVEDSSGSTTLSRQPQYVPKPVIPTVSTELPAPKILAQTVEPRPPRFDHSTVHDQRPAKQNDTIPKAAKAPMLDGRQLPQPSSLPLTKGDTQQTPKPSLMKEKRVVTRTLWTFIMIGVFIGETQVWKIPSHGLIFVPGLLLLGHAYMVLLVILCQTLVYREVTALFSLKGSKPGLGSTESKGKDPWSKTLNWYFFAVTNYFLYGESIIYYFKVVHLHPRRVGLT